MFKFSFQCYCTKLFLILLCYSTVKFSLCWKALIARIGCHTSGEMEIILKTSLKLNINIMYFIHISCTITEHISLCYILNHIQVSLQFYFSQYLYFFVLSAKKLYFVTVNFLALFHEKCVNRIIHINLITVKIDSQMKSS